MLFRCSLLLLSFTAFLHAQGSVGSVTGLVTDATGAFIPESRVLLRNVATGDELHTAGTSAGVFAFPSVRIGVYTLEVEAAGFRKSVTESLDASCYGRPFAQLNRLAGRSHRDESRLVASSSGDPSASCSPAELASVSPTTAILLNLKLAVRRFFAWPALSV